MALLDFTKITQSVAIIQTLSDLPNLDDGLTAGQLKAKFDEAAETILKPFINDTLIEELASIAAGLSGSQRVGHDFGGLYGTSVHDALAAIIAAGSGTIPPDNSIDEYKLVDDFKNIVYSVAGVGTNAVAVTEGKIATYFDGLKISLSLDNDMSAASSIDINTQGIKDLKYYDSDGVLQDFETGKKEDRYLFEYDGVQFILLSKIPVAPAAVFMGALVTPSSDVSTSTAGPYPFNSETEDTDGFHDNVTNNSRLTIPSGVSRVRLTAMIQFNSDTAIEYTMIKNGSYAIGLPKANKETDAGKNSYDNLVSASISVVPGDYFEIIGDIAVTRTLDADSWFAIEVIG